LSSENLSELNLLATNEQQLKVKWKLVSSLKWAVFQVRTHTIFTIIFKKLGNCLLALKNNYIPLNKV